MPTADQWLEQWSLPGAQGGMLAKRVDWAEAYQEHIECASLVGGDLPPQDANHTTSATWDLRRLRFHCRVTSKRKSCPKHSVPAAIIAMLLDPNVNMQSNAATRTLGLGFDSSPLQADNTYHVFHASYAHLNRCAFSPLKWHLSWGAAIPKKSSHSKGAAWGKRVVHRLDEQGKCFLARKIAFRLKKRPAHLHHGAQGFRKRARREAAILCQASSLWRLKRTKRNGCMLNTDLSNAFGSTSWPTLEDQN